MGEYDDDYRPSIDERLAAGARAEAEITQLRAELEQARAERDGLRCVVLAVEAQRDRWLRSSSSVTRGAGQTLQDVFDMCAAAPSTPPEPAKPAPAAGAVGVGLPNLVAYVDTQIMGHRKEEDRYRYLDQRTSKFHEGCRRAFEDMRGKIEALANEAAADGEG
jgi:hypothetical protein